MWETRDFKLEDHLLRCERAQQLLTWLLLATGNCVIFLKLERKKWNVTNDFRTKKWVNYPHVLGKLFRLERKQETRIQMNFIKSIGSKEGKLCFFISRSSCVKSCSFVLPQGSLLLVSWLLCQNVKDTVELTIDAD